MSWATHTLETSSLLCINALLDSSCDGFWDSCFLEIWLCFLMLWQLLPWRSSAALATDVRIMCHLSLYQRAPKSYRYVNAGDSQLYLLSWDTATTKRRRRILKLFIKTVDSETLRKCMDARKQQDVFCQPRFARQSCRGL